MKNNYSIKVPLKNSPYEIIVGKNVIEKNKKKIFSAIKDAQKIFIITDTVIRKLHLKKIIKIIPKKIFVKTFVISSGEKMKDIKTINKLISFLLKKYMSI